MSSGTRRCRDCGRPLKSDQDKYCSNACRYQANDQSPEVWDGVTKYSTSGPLRRSYQATCLSAGHAQGDDIWLTALELRAMRPLPRCYACGSHVSLVPSDAAGMGSPSQGRLGARVGEAVA